MPSPPARMLWLLLERTLDAVIFAGLVLLAEYTSSRFERAVLLAAAALMLIGWVAAWRRRR